MSAAFPSDLLTFNFQHYRLLLYVNTRVGRSGKMYPILATRGGISLVIDITRWIHLVIMRVGLEPPLH